MNDEPRPADGHWHRHGLSTGTIFGLTQWGVSRIPRAMSYGIGHVGTWLAYRLMRSETAALIDNLRVMMPHLSEAELRALTLLAYRTYAREVIDFIRSIQTPPEKLKTWMSPLNNFDRVGQAGSNGMIFLTAHVGNIELGAVVLRVSYKYPLAVVLLPEHDPKVNEYRNSMRAKVGIETIEVRQDAETALRIRRRHGGDGGRPAARARPGAGGVLWPPDLVPPLAGDHGLHDGRPDGAVLLPATARRALRRRGPRPDRGPAHRRPRGERAGRDAELRHGARRHRQAIPAPLVQLLPVLGHRGRSRRGGRELKDRVN
jgi:hypothetical protein